MERHKEHVLQNSSIHHPKIYTHKKINKKKPNNKKKTGRYKTTTEKNPK